MAPLGLSARAAVIAALAAVSINWLSATANAGPVDTAVLVVDSSGSMTQGRLSEARTAVKRLAGAFDDSTSVGLVTVKGTAKLQHAPDLDRQSLLAAIDGLTGSGDTALLDGLLFAQDLVAARGGGRLIVLTDGADTTSTTSKEEVIDAARSAGVRIDFVALRPDQTDLRTLRTIAGGTGGSVVSGNDAATLIDNVIAQGTLSSPTATTTESTTESAAAAVPVPVPPPAASRLAPSQAAAPAAQDQMGAILLAIFTVLMGLACSVLIMWWWVASKRRERLGDIAWYRGTPHAANSEQRQFSLLEDWNSRLARRMDITNIQDQLACAGLPTAPVTWLLGRLLLASAAALVTVVVFGLPLLGFLVCAPLGWFLPLMWLKARINKRRRVFADQLPDFLILLASTLRAGLSFAHGIESVASEGRGEVERQMRWVLRQVQVGSELDDALLACAARMANDDLRWVVLSLGIQREVGGNLSTILETAARTIKARQSLRAEVRTLSAEGRLSAYVLIALPLGVLLFLVILRPQYVSALWSDPLGWALLIGLAIAFVVGWLWTRAIVRIKA